MFVDKKTLPWLNPGLNLNRAQIFNINTDSFHKWRKYTLSIGKKDDLGYLAIPSRLVFNVSPAIEKSRLFSNGLLSQQIFNDTYD